MYWRLCSYYYLLHKTLIFKKRLNMKKDIKYTWDLSKFCENKEEWFAGLEVAKEFVEKAKSYKGKLSDKKALLEFLNLEQEYAAIVNNLYMYASHNNSVDLKNPRWEEMLNLIEAVDSKHGIETSFSAPELLSYGEEYLKELIEDKTFEDYDFGFFKLLRSKKHILSEAEEKILTATSNFAGDFGKVFGILTDANIKFPDVENKSGKKLPLTNTNYSLYLESKDRILRKNTFEQLYRTYISFGETISANYIASLKTDWFYASTANFNSCLEMSLYPDNINPLVYNNLIENVHSNLKLLHKYFTIKKNSLGLSDFTYYDQFVKSKGLNKKYTFEQCIEVICQALAPLGEDYVALIRKSVKERWMDVFPKENKQSGAYQSDVYGKTPVILLNFKGLTDDVFTAAHELGHAMHSYYSNANNSMPKSQYTIFLAEVASTVNEVLLLKYLYNNAKNNTEKIYYLEQFLGMFKSTLFRQTMFAEFEDYAHKLIETNQPIRLDVLTKHYGELNKKYHGKALKHNKNIDFEWLRIPHFYSSYYVYKYSTGLTSAITLATNILNGTAGALEKYKEFLSSGGKNFSVETLKIAGVDLETSEPYETAFSQMQWALNELSKLNS